MKYQNITEGADERKQILSRQTNDFNKFTTALEKTLETVIELDNTFSLLNAQLILIIPLNSGLILDTTDESIDHITSKIGTENNKGLPVGNEYASKKSQSEVEGLSIAEIINKMATVGEGAIKASTALGELPPAINKLKKAFSIIGDMNEGGKGIAGLFTGLEGGITSAEAVSAAGELITGATGVAEAGAGFGPPGWIVGAGALIIGFYSVVVVWIAVLLGILLVLLAGEETQLNLKANPFLYLDHHWLGWH